MQKNIREIGDTPDTPETLETLETVKLFGSNIFDTPDTPDTLETVKCLNSNISDTPDTPETLETLETVNRLDSNISDTPDTLNTPDHSVVENIVARLFPRTHQTYTERVKEGVSTYVYRIHYANEIFYLRILPEIDASFAPEVTVHQLLRAKQVKVPNVLYFEHVNEELGRSIMLTSEIKGKPLSQYSTERDQRTILQEAGRDLASMNSLPVRDFGWIRRDSQKITTLEATLPTNRDFIYEHLEHDLASLTEKVLTSSRITTIRQLVQRYDGWLNDSTQAWLAHGDFDVTHIYHDQGRYTGIIDFGEIRGTHSLYDLAHFRMHDGETLPNLVLPYLIEGYREMTPLPPDYEQHVSFFSLLIAIRTLARALEKRPETVQNHQALLSIQRDVELLLAKGG